MEFDAEFFSGNRQRLLESTYAPLVVLAAQGLLQRTTDTTYPFRQDSNFWYLTGIEEPDYILVFNGEEAFLIAPPRGEHRDQWDGAVNTEALKRVSGISEILDHHDGWNKLDRLIKKHKKVYTATPVEAYYELFGFYTNPARGVLQSALKKHRTLELVDVRKAIAKLRQIKQRPEINAITKAIEITCATLAEVRKKINGYNFEYEIVADITAGFIRRGASGHAYEPIVAYGPHAATIHHVKSVGKIEDGSSILFDVGAEVSNYAADISRTFAVGAPNERTKQVYDAVVRVRDAAYKLLKPGVIHKEYEQKVDKIMAKELHKLGVLNDITDKKKFRKLYPHLTSHHLGLDTHDSADYDAPLEPGMVLTVEPGIYLPKEGIGVRIEDDVLITKTGIKILSANLPSTLV